MTILKGWKTMLANALMAIIPILELAEIKAVLPPDWLPYYALGMVLVNMFLRWLTTTPVGKKA